jgi:hypothetical protein
MEAPHVDPVGVSHTPPGYRIGPRSYSRAQRLVAGSLAVIFTGVVVLTTAWSLGAYCLTSDGENTRQLPYRKAVTAGEPRSQRSCSGGSSCSARSWFRSQQAARSWVWASQRWPRHAPLASSRSPV